VGVNPFLPANRGDQWAKTVNITEKMSS